ncbi:TlpA family protein disulfide reductase [Methylobacterium sp. E-016]|uniref:TlpA disulfide reductase family protein n=1 Tax=Methylobacterium sp. E-016 TaxID=2836556 RepID=UPI001FBA74CB|nr:TlpA disulfide reductase family protein [Methylobacterium sp. E-016]MCJ2075928.1 TlpA family protein disulfide reductase [Methylobacterium sp. E-016]
MPGRLMGAAIGAGLVTALAAGLALYGTGAGPGNAPAPCAGSAAAVARVDAAARGDVAAMQAPEKARPAPDIAFKGPGNGGKDGGGEADLRLSDFRGRLVLLNLWATWCAPCKAEMPALDRLEAALGGKDFAVVAINLDTRNLDRPPVWMRDNGIARLAYYADPGGRVLPAVQRDTGSPGLPTTLLVDPAGCTIGVMKGPAEWSSPDGLALIRAALGRTS